MEKLLDVGVTNTFGLFFFNVCFPPWGENAYYFAHNRHFEIPEDAKIISGPGLVTGGSPEKIQELVDSLWVGWIDLMVTKIHQKKNINTWLILKSKSWMHQLWFIVIHVHSVQFETVSVPFIWLTLRCFEEISRLANVFDTRWCRTVVQLWSRKRE